MDFEVLDEAFGDAADHIIDDGASGAVKGTQLARGLRVTGDGQFVVFVAQINSGRKGKGEFAFRTFDRDDATVIFDSNFFGQADWFNSYA